MLKKLLKYDLIYKYKVLIIFYVISIIVSILTRITTMDNPSLAILVINKILCGTVIAFVVNIIVNVLTNLM